MLILHFPFVRQIQLTSLFWVCPCPHLDGQASAKSQIQSTYHHRVQSFGGPQPQSPCLNLSELTQNKILVQAITISSDTPCLQYWQPHNALQ